MSFRAGGGLNRRATVAGGQYDDPRAGVLPRPRARAARPAPRRADGLLLPHARLAVRGRGRRAGDDAAGVARTRALRGPGGAALVALPDRHERVPRHAERAIAARAADGLRTGAAPRREPEHPSGGDVDRAD